MSFRSFFNTSFLTGHQSGFLETKRSPGRCSLTMGNKKHSIAFLIIGITTLLIGTLLDSGNFQVKSIETGYGLKLAENPTDKSWYYEIYNNGNLQIRQEYVPGISEKVRFASKREAERIGTIVLNRLNSGQFPVITEQDLEKNGISYQ